MPKRLNLQIEGIVQGVGFRPFVFSLARENGLTGWVLNNSRGVEIEIEGPEESLLAFLSRLKNNPPPLSRILAIRQRDIPPANDSTFAIYESKLLADRIPFISPDTDVCDDCLDELFNPSDRRYRYPFINCTNCGPRFTIIKDIPYDRDKTTMQQFAMCPECGREYHDPLDRRFHAQPIGCWECGPRLKLLDGSGNDINSAEPVQAAVDLLLSGKIVAIKGLGGFHLAVDAASEDAVLRLRARKHREEKPFAIMVRTIEAARRVCFISPQEEQILTSKLKPILLLKKRPDHNIADAVAPRNRFFGVMLPYTPIHHLLLESSFDTLVMTSANISDEPITKDIGEALERLHGIADFYLTHNRDIHVRADDSILRTAAGRPSILRRSRGMVPLAIPLLGDGPEVLACGAELKNAVCFTKNSVAFLSQYIGDMESIEAERIFTESITHLKNILQVAPEVIAYDLHPGYRATRYALEQHYPRAVGVQHHFAHVAGCLAEHGLEGPALGVAFDGTGYGDDGAIWGSEFFTFDYSRYKRRAHFAYVPLPGGDAAAREPYRMAISYLYLTFKEKLRELNLPLLRKYADRVPAFITMITKGLNSPLTSSCGRLFDAVASLAGLRDVMTFEGQAPMELEMAIDEPHDFSYRYRMREQDAGPDFIISFEPMIEAIVEDVLQGKTVSFISCRFHNTIAQVIVDMCEQLSRKEGIRLVALSGGVFQNLYLLTRAVDLLQKKAFRVLIHEQVPANDGGIALGQAVIARRACR